MIDVVADADVLTKELLAHAFVQAGAFVLQRGGGEIIKKKPDEIEHCRGFEDYRVTSRRKLARVDGKMRFLASPLGEFLWSNARTSAELALAQLAAESSCAVMENSECVSR